MSQGLNVLYRSAAEDYARTLTSVFGERVHSIVLFGSVPQKQARASSDIDVLVVGAEPELREKVLDIAYEAMERSHFAAFISVVFLNGQELQELVRLRSPFISHVLKQGAILYDDGTFSSLRHGVPSSR